MAQKDSVKTSRPFASFTTIRSSGVVMSASLLQFSNNPSGKPACLFFILQDSAFRIRLSNLQSSPILGVVREASLWPPPAVEASTS
jgi:hypothetical protein